METVSTARVGKLNYLPFVIFGLAAFFYLYEFCLQVSPGVMSNALMADLHIDAAGFGIMAAFYFYAYAPMQVPAGLLYDRFGPRILITVAIAICALGALFFGLTNSLILASLGRFFMGVGSAFAFIGTLVLIARWFPAKHFALMAGVAQLMSSIGAIAGEAPLALAVGEVGWRYTMMGLAALGFVSAFFIWRIVRDSPDGQFTDHHKSKPKIGWSGQLKKLNIVCANRQTWAAALYVFCVWAPIAIFAALWGVPYMMSLYDVSAAHASEPIIWIWVGIAVGSPLVGWWSDYIGRRCLPLAMSAALGLTVTSCMLFVSGISMGTMNVLMFCFGLAASGQVLTFAVIRDFNKLENVGTACGFNNMATVAGGALFQPLVGLLLRFQWDGEMVGHAPVYSVAAYNNALLILPACYLVALFAAIFLIKETYCRPSSR